LCNGISGEPGAQIVRQLHAQTTQGPDHDGDLALLQAAPVDPYRFDQLFDQFGDAVLNYCYYRLGTWEEAEDAAQQVFANALAAHNRFRARSTEPAESIRSWIFTIAHHEVANRRRSRTRHPQASLDSASVVADPGPSPEELAIAADRQGRVLRLMTQLSPDQRQVVELRLAGLTDAEIAQVLDRTPGAIRATQFRAVARLRDLLGIDLRGKGGSDV
jgi:RNA polymerase sigma-70 factor (ECF subfamily)